MTRADQGAQGGLGGARATITRIGITPMIDNGSYVSFLRSHIGQPRRAGRQAPSQTNCGYPRDVVLCGVGFASFCWPRGGREHVSVAGLSAVAAVVCGKV